MFFLIYLYISYTKTLVLQHCFDRVMSKEPFQVNPKGFNIVLSPQIVFYTRILYDTYVYIFHTYVCFLTLMFSISRFSRPETFIVYYFCSLSMLYTHSALFYPFQVLHCQVLLLLLLFRTVVELLVFFSTVGGFLFSLSTGYNL